MKTGIIILAAGSSSRLGEPKQLLKYNDKSLLCHVAEESLKVSSSVLVVTGFNRDSIEDEIKKMNVLTAFNPYWQEGMGSSIQFGIGEMMHRFPAIENVIISVCDQPFIESSVFLNLIIKHQQTQKGIIASEYQNVLGTPVLFEKNYFSVLAKLSGNEGAKKILNRFTDDLESVHFEKGHIDIDTQQNYEQLIRENDSLQRS